MALSLQKVHVVAIWLVIASGFCPLDTSRKLFRLLVSISYKCILAIHWHHVNTIRHNSTNAQGGQGVHVSVTLTIDTRARPPELVEAFVVARSGPRGS